MGSRRAGWGAQGTRRERGRGSLGDARRGSLGDARRDGGGYARRAAQASVALVAYLALAVAAWEHVWLAHPTRDMPMGGDQWRNVWFLAWVPFAISHGHNPLYSGYANVDVGVNLLTGSGVPLLAVLAAPVTAAWGPVLSYDVCLTASLALSALAAFSLLWRVVGSWPGAFAGGLLYGFGPALIAHASAGQLNLAFTVLVPLIALALLDVGSGRLGAARGGLALGVLVIAQFLVSAELLVDTAIMAAVGLVATAVVLRRSAAAVVGRLVRALVPATALGVAVLAYPLWVMLAGPAHVAGRLNLNPQGYREDLLAPLLPDSLQLLRTHGSLLAEANGFASSPTENGAYLGVTLLAVLAVGIVALRRRPVVVVAALGGAAAFALSLGGRLAVSTVPQVLDDGQASDRTRMPEWVISHLPLLESAIPARFSLFLDLAAAAVLAAVVHEVRDRSRSPGGAVAWPALTAAVALVPVIPAVPFGGVGAKAAPAVLADAPSAAVPAGSTVVLLPYPSGAFPVPTLWQAALGFPVRLVGGDFLVPRPPADTISYNGQFGYAADTTLAEVLTSLDDGRPPPEDPALRAALRAELAGLGVDRVVALPPFLGDPAQAEGFGDWLLGPPTSAGPGAVVWTPRAPGAPGAP